MSIFSWFRREKGLLSYTELVKLVDDGVINAKYENINPASIDVTLDDTIRVECKGSIYPIKLGEKENIVTREFKMTSEGYDLAPGEVILASTVEEFNLPDDIVAEYVLKSSQARNFLNNMLAGYCDPGFNDSKLTLELKNETRFHKLTLCPGDKCGQVKFFRVKKVPKHKSYSVVGRYNNQTKATASKGII